MQLSISSEFEEFSQPGRVAYVFKEEELILMFANYLNHKLDMNIGLSLDRQNSSEFLYIRVNLNNEYDMKKLIMFKYLYVDSLLNVEKLLRELFGCFNHYDKMYTLVHGWDGLKVKVVVPVR